MPVPLLVLGTVGTDHHPFDRLVTWLDAWYARQDPARVRCVIQTGTSAPARHAESVATLPYEQLADLLRRADAVVCHGGPGTIMECRGVGLRPISVPRRVGLGEHVDDHQAVFTRRVARSGLLEIAETEDTLTAHLDSVLAHPERFRSGADDMGNRETVERIERLVTDVLVRRGRRHGAWLRTGRP